MEGEDFFDGLTPEPEAVVKTQETPVVETPAAPEPVAEVPAPEPVAEVKPEPGHVPINALLDEREKRKELERQLTELRKASETKQSLPDPIEDPVGFQQQSMAQVQQMLLDTRLNMSETLARRHHGDEATEAAKAWAMEKFKNSPAFWQEVISQSDPYDYAIQAYNREQVANAVTPDDFKAFQAWKAAQAQIAAAPVAAPTAPAVPVPRSIASAPSAGGVAHEPVDPESGYAAAIP